MVLPALLLISESNLKYYSKQKRKLSMTKLDGTNISHYGIYLNTVKDGYKYTLVRKTDTDDIDTHYVGEYKTQRSAEMVREGMIKAFTSKKDN